MKSPLFLPSMIKDTMEGQEEIKTNKQKLHKSILIILSCGFLHQKLFSFITLSIFNSFIVNSHLVTLSPCNQDDSEIGVMVYERGAFGHQINSVAGYLVRGLEHTLPLPRCRYIQAGADGHQDQLCSVLRPKISIFIFVLFLNKFIGCLGGSVS